MYLICSAGRVGTTMFIDWLAQYRKTNNRKDRDRLKHLTRPVVDKNIEKAVYLYTKKPEEQAVSLVKRFKSSQIKKLTGHWLEIEEPKDLKTYNHDVFNFQEIFRNWWFCGNVGYDIAFVNYDTMWDYLDEIGEFLELPGKMHTFPTKKLRQRTISILKKDRDLHNHLNDIYRQYKKWLCEIPNFYVKYDGRGFYMDS